MGGFNLPPGCSVSDIPGNTRADMEAEALYDAIYKALEPLGLSDEAPGFETAADLLYMLVTDRMASAYAEGQSDEAMGREFTAARSAEPPEAA